MAGPVDVESVGKRWFVRARRVVVLEVRPGVGLWCFALVLNLREYHRSSHHWRGRWFVQLVGLTRVGKELKDLLVVQ
ncbi:hypothetical protein ACN38_g502 [Penicillium nordicum]|uniref:Uncharacterized protein n=1 Tax=Penicillium nordicum TaxID=229535 RepID=A0A0M9WKR1_9EURO|nr:hypothetical protein ACN38_g502 [Penicillium nordicum]